MTTTTRITSQEPGIFSPGFHAAEVEVTDEAGRYQVDISYKLDLDGVGGTYCVHTTATAYIDADSDIANVGATRFGGLVGAPLTVLATTGDMRTRSAERYVIEVAKALREVDLLAAEHILPQLNQEG